MPWYAVVFLILRERLMLELFLWGCLGWQAAQSWVSVSPEMVGFPAPIR